MVINPRYNQEKYANLCRNFFLELNVPCERAHCEVKKNVPTVSIGPSKLKLLLKVRLAFDPVTCTKRFKFD